MKIWSINYSLRFGSVKIHKHCLYWKLFITDIYSKIFFSSLLFFSYICWSVNCMSWMSKFHNFFLTCTETEARFIFEGFKCCPLWEFHFHFLTFFIWSVNCSRDFFSHFVGQYIVWVKFWVIWHILEMSRSLSIN